MIHEPEACANLIAQPETLLLVGVDAFAPLRGHVLQPEKRAERDGECLAALLAEIWSVALRHGVSVAAAPALLHSAGGQLLTSVWRKDHPVDDVLGAFMINHGL